MDTYDEKTGLTHLALPSWGPWLGVPKEKQTLCAVVDCERVGVFAGYCPADRGHHHHGCIHYDAPSVADVVAKHGLKFREGWGLLCTHHLRMMEGK